MSYKFDAIGIAARLWCLPQHEKKEMDSEFCRSICEALTAAYNKGSDDAMQGNRSIKAALDEEFRRGREVMREKCESIAEGRFIESAPNSGFGRCAKDILEAIRNIPLEG